MRAAGILALTVAERGGVLTIGSSGSRAMSARGIAGSTAAPRGAGPGALRATLHRSGRSRQDADVLVSHFRWVVDDVCRCSGMFRDLAQCSERTCLANERVGMTPATPRAHEEPRRT